jgi:hypothetical protein
MAEQADDRGGRRRAINHKITNYSCRTRAACALELKNDFGATERLASDGQMSSCRRSTHDDRCEGGSNRRPSAYKATPNGGLKMLVIAQCHAEP